MIVNFNEHPWVHQGNINKVNKLIMSVEDYQLARIEALEKRVKELEEEANERDKERVYNEDADDDSRNKNK